MDKRTTKFEVIPLNLQQGMIRATGIGDNVINQVVAIYSHHKNVLLIMVDWRDEMETIRAICPMQNFRTKFADHFRIDSWDKKLDED